MKIVFVEPREIMVGIEFSRSEIEKLLTALNKATITFDSEKEPEVAEANEFLISFYKDLSKLSEKIGGSDDST